MSGTSSKPFLKNIIVIWFKMIAIHLMGPMKKVLMSSSSNGGIKRDETGRLTALSATLRLEIPVVDPILVDDKDGGRIGFIPIFVFRVKNVADHWSFNDDLGKVASH